jgi:hypothetical protein
MHVDAARSQKSGEARERRARILRAIVDRLDDAIGRWIDQHDSHAIDAIDRKRTWQLALEPGSSGEHR